jgi:hypothetical protein
MSLSGRGAGHPMGTVAALILSTALATAFGGLAFLTTLAFGWYTLQNTRNEQLGKPFRML